MGVPSLRHVVRCDEDGAAATEFAIVLPVLLLLLAAVIDFGLLFTAQIGLSNAAREGVRAVAVSDDDANAAALEAFTARRFADPLPNDAGFLEVVEDCAGPDTTARVRVRASYDLLLLPLPGDRQSITLSGDGVMRCGG